jgi:catechol 2,3-dioxygenase-like lactoylglutathione lyase family enzyme
LKPAERKTMLDAISDVGVWVRDQEEAKAFYTEKLGFDVREDVTLEELGGYREARGAERGRTRVRAGRVTDPPDRPRSFSNA